MNKKIVSYIYKMCLENKEGKFKIPSIRWFVYKYDLTQSEVVKTFDFFKAQNLFMSEQGSKTFVVKKPFLNLFKNDTWLMFGDKIKRHVISEDIVLNKDKYEHIFKREFTLNGKVVLISFDKIYTVTKKPININQGVDFFVKNNFQGQKIVQRELIAVDIEGFEEYKRIKTKKCIMTETKVFSENQLISHSFSLTPWNYFRDFKTEIML